MPSDDATTVSGRPAALLAFERLGDDLDRDLLRAVEAAQGAVGDLLTRPSDVPVGLDRSLLPAARRLAGEWRALGRQAGDAGRRLETADAVDDRRAGGMGDVVGASAAGFGRGLGRFAGGVVEGLVAIGERQEDNRDIPWRLLGALRDGGLPGLLDRADHELAHAARRDAGLLTPSVGQFVDTFVVRNPLVGGVPYWTEQVRRNGVAATIEAGAEYAGEALPEATLMAVGTKARLPRVTRVEPARAVVVPTAAPEGRRPADLHPGSAGASPAYRAAFEHYLDELRRSDGQAPRRGSRTGRHP